MLEVTLSLSILGRRGLSVGRRTGKLNRGIQCVATTADFAKAFNLSDYEGRVEKAIVLGWCIEIVSV